MFTFLLNKEMIYNLRSCQSQLSSDNSGSDMMLYRGVSYSSASKDLAERRLFFSQAISHNVSDGSQEGETYRTQSEWIRVRQQLQITDDGDAMQTQHNEFFERGDQYARSCYFISCWSSSESLATQFADQFSQKAILSITKSDLLCAFHTSVEYWNSLQPNKYGEDGSLNLDWDPAYVGHASGSVKYVKPSELKGSLPFRLARAMRLPDCFKHENEWRIALDLSRVPSSVSSAALLESDLMPSHLADAMQSPSEISDADPGMSRAELMPMIEISTSDYPKYERGIWLNHCDLSSCSSFKFTRL
jgi:hypothetical protein